MPPTGRNDPCHCGSGLKYKKCCMVKDLASAPSLDDLEAKRVEAIKKMSEQEWDSAIAIFKSILNQAPRPHVIMQAIGACHEGREEYLQAAECYEKAIQDAPESDYFILYRMLGTARACAQRNEKAREAFARASEAAANEKEKAEAQAALRLIDEVSQGKEAPRAFYIQIQLQRSFSEMDADNYAEAEQRLTKILSIDPDNATILYNLGVALTFLKREEEAIRRFEEALEINPDFVQAWYNLGQICLIGRQDYSRALHCYHRASVLRPDYISAHHQMAVTWEKLGDESRALECWKKTLELDPGNAPAAERIEKLEGAAP